MGMVHYHRPTARKRLMAGEKIAWVENSPRRDYIRRIVLSIPPWLEKRELLQLNAMSASISKATGIPHHLDHIVPVSHPEVCGLTVPWNLRIAPYRVNIAKGNRWCPEQMDLFADMPTEEQALDAYLHQVMQECLTNEEPSDSVPVP